MADADDDARWFKEEQEQEEKWRKEYDERRRKEIAERAPYYDTESPVIWKQYVIGPVPLWRRVLWWFFPPSHAKMRRIVQRRNDDAIKRMINTFRP